MRVRIVPHRAAVAPYTAEDGVEGRVQRQVHGRAHKRQPALRLDSYVVLDDSAGGRACVLLPARSCLVRQGNPYESLPLCLFCSII